MSTSLWFPSDRLIHQSVIRIYRLVDDDRPLNSRYAECPPAAARPAATGGFWSERIPSGATARAVRVRWATVRSFRVGSSGIGAPGPTCDEVMPSAQW